jgi:phosphoserine aminotransferase
MDLSNNVRRPSELPITGDFILSRLYNFSAGPAMLPESVLQQAAAEMMDWQGSGMSVMEMSHRGKEYMGIHAQAQADFRELLNIPANYKVLFLQGGGTMQFMQVPCNLLRGKASADYIVTGEWSAKAVKEAARFCAPRVAASTEASGFTQFPRQAELKLSKQAAYVYYCMNETIHGVESFDIPEVGKVPLVTDISSTFLSRPVDVSKFGLIYGGAQKNIGPAGLTIVIIREDLIGKGVPLPPSILDYKTQADADSMLNTPPSYAIYIAGLVFKWLKSQGGLKAVETRNIAKAKLLYDYLDSTDFYISKVRFSDRSRMNVPFFLQDERKNDDFLKGAKDAGMVQLKGHRVLGGMRASIYNAMPIEGVQHLVEYMKGFEKQHG